MIKFLSSLFFLIIIFSVFILLVFLIFELVASFLGSLYIRSKKEKIKRALFLLKLKPGEIFYDLGSGDGRVLILTAKKYKVKAKGIEINPFLVYLSQKRIKKERLSKKVEVKWGNFLKEDLSSADALFVYINQKGAQRIERKFKKELKKGTKIVLYPASFSRIALVKVDEKFKDLKLYQI